MRQAWNFFWIGETANTNTERSRRLQQCQVEISKVQYTKYNKIINTDVRQQIC